MDVFRVLLIGLGNIAMGYDLGHRDTTWTHVGAITKHSNFKIIAAIDPNVDTHQPFSRLSSAKVFREIDEFLESEHGKVDLVVIASPTAKHLEHYVKIKALEPRLVLMEKPLLAANQDLDMFMDEARHGPNIMVNLFRLCQSQINLKLHELANTGLCRIHVRYSQQLHHNAIHFISLIMRHFGSLKSQEDLGLKNYSDIHLRFEKADVLLQPAMGDLDDNSMIVYSAQGSLYYLNGGRIFFFVDAQHFQHHYDQAEFQHHMLKVYEHCHEVINGKSDDSLELAFSGHNILMEYEQYEA